MSRSVEPGGMTRQIVAAAIGMAGGFAVLFIGSFGLFVKPISVDRGWSRAEASLLVTMGFLGYALAAPIAGSLFDKYGARPILAIGIMLFASGLAALGLTNGGLPVFAAIAFVIGVSGAVTAPSGYVLILSKMTDRKLGLTLGLAMLGLGIGVTTMPVVTQASISALGWRGAYLVAAGLSLMLGAIALLLGFGRGFPTNAEPVDAKTGPAADGMSLRHALLSWRFWLLGITALVISAIGFGASTHLPAILSDRGLDAGAAARAAGLGGAGLFLGRIGAAVLMDRIHAPLVAMGCCLIGAVGLYVLVNLQPDQSFLLIVVPLMIGVLGGSEGDTMPYLTRRYFGAASFGSIYGCIIGLAGLGGLAGPLIFGRAFDLAGSYGAILTVAAVVSAASGVALMAFGPYRYAVPKDQN